jgi:hypothetical protein
LEQVNFSPDRKMEVSRTAERRELKEKEFAAHFAPPP